MFASVLPVNVDEDFAKAFKIYLKNFRKKDDKPLVGKSINMYLWALQSLLDLIKTEGIPVVVPQFDQYRAKQVKNETNKYPPLNDKEKLAAFRFYRANKPEYYLFLLFIYYSGFRISELHRLQVKLFDFNNETMRIDWYSAKNGLSNFVQMLPPLKKALLHFGIDKLPRNWYLFGEECKPSAKKWVGGSITTGYWEHYRERIGIPPDKKQYGFKHSFVKDYIERNKGNINWEWLRRHLRHATVKQTQDYVSEITAYFLKYENISLLDFHAESGNT